jgi:hypothetical protein
MQEYNTGALTWSNRFLMEKRMCWGEVIILQKDGRRASTKRSVADIHLKLRYQRLAVDVASAISVCVDHLKT